MMGLKDLCRVFGYLYQIQKERFVRKLNEQVLQKFLKRYLDSSFH